MNKLLSMLGLSARAGRLVSGVQAVEIALKKGEARLIVLDDEASEGTKKQMTDACLHKKTPLITVPASSLGDAVGKPGRMIAAVTDNSFADRIYQLYKEIG
ncbi:MAG: ribosomal L7Ae/L30e/S12e/Gadd45 family protein [Clostridia bacterium]|nr:ribosomal L7Ae/L30e/S12e/Gadd45 family protein [Clostridia bacterium]